MYFLEKINKLIQYVRIFLFYFFKNFFFSFFVFVF